jgi:tRNA threonylcarbamoyladenosine biosynthesis protein TsaE
MEFLSKGVAETAQIAANFVKTTLAKPDFDGATIVGLYGELGSGKTTFMKYLAESLGVEEIIQSPTFVIMKKYELRNLDFLIHIDAYRIDKEEEMLNLGWQEITADPKNIVCIEWPERISGIMPQHIKIFFEHGDNESHRKIKIER